MCFLTEQQLESAGLSYLPTEIWFIIFKHEHSMKLMDVNRQVVERADEIEKQKINKIRTIIDVADWDDINNNWDDAEMVAFANTVHNIETNMNDIQYYLEMNADF